MPTVQELLLAARAAKQAGAYAPRPSAAPQEEFSLTGAAKELGAFGLNALGVVGNTLDLPGSMVRDVARSITSGQFHNPFDQLLTPFTDVNRATGRQILEDLGMRKNRETGIGGWLSDPGEGARDVGGFVAEVLLDPFGPIGKTLKAPQAINAAFRGAGRAGAAGVRLLPGGSRALQAGGDALEVVNRLRKKYLDRTVGGAFSKTGQSEIALLNKAADIDNNESLRFAVDASQLAEDTGWSVRGEVPDILEKHGAIARYVARADMRAISPVLEQDLVRDVAGTFPKDMAVRGIRLGLDNKHYALLEGLPDHVQFPVDQLKVVGDSLKTVPERLIPVLDEMRERAAAKLVQTQHAGVDVAKHYDENGHEFFHQYMLDAQQHAILRQGGGLVHGHRSAALKIAAGQPEARNALFQSRGTVHGPGGLADIFKQPVWDDVNRAFTDLNETFPPETRIKDMDGQVVQVLPGHVGFQHIQKFADKVGMEPLELWRQLGLDPEKGWAKAEDVERALNVFKGKLDAEAARIGLSSGEIPTKRTYSLGLSEVLTDSNVSRIRSNPFIGRGGNAVVHDIPDSPFVARIPNHVKGTVLNDFKEVADVVPGMKVGQAVAENSQGVQILQRQEGMPAGMAVSSGDVAADNLRYVKSVRAAADMPQDAYDRLAINLKRLNEKGFQFDPSKSNNLLIDEAGAEFNIVDVSPGSYKSGLEDMLVTLLGNTHYYKYMDAVGKGVTDQHLARSFGSIFEKASLAAQKAGIPLQLGSSGEYSAKIAGRNLVGADAAKWAEQAAAEGRQRAAAAVAKRSTTTRPSIYFGKQMFRDLIAGKNTAVPLADTQNLAAGHILPNGQTMRQVSDPKATLESLAKSYVGDSAISKRLSEEAASWGDKPLYEWYVDGERRLFTPDVHTDLSTRFKDNLGKLKKAAEDSPVNQLDAIADSYQLIFKNRYSHLINEKMPYFDDKGLLQFVDNTPGPTAGQSVKMTLKEFKDQQDALARATRALEDAPFGPERDRVRQELRDIGYSDEQTNAMMEVFEAQARTFAAAEGSDDVDAYFRKFSSRVSTPGEVGQDALRQPFATTSREFKQWFGDYDVDPVNASKVVDTFGKPLVVYHGTGKPDLGSSAAAARNQKKLSSIRDWARWKSAEKETEPLRKEAMRAAEVKRGEFASAVQKVVSNQHKHFPSTLDSYDFSSPEAFAKSLYKNASYPEREAMWKRGVFTEINGKVNTSLSVEEFERIRNAHQDWAESEATWRSMNPRPKSDMPISDRMESESVAFDTGRWGANDPGYYAAGTHFSDNAAEASKYAESQLTGQPGVLPVYLNIRKPFVLGETQDAVAEKLMNEAIEKHRRIASVSRKGDLDQLARAFALGRTEGLKAAGYDGMVVKTKAGTEYIIFEPEQAKSIYNKGSFDPGNPDIMYQPVHHTTPHDWLPEPGFPHGRPRLDKIGTGVGRQNHGWGWYSSESEDVAKAGAAEMGPGATRLKFDIPDDDAARLMDYDITIGQQSGIAGQLRSAVAGQQEFVDRFMAASPADRLKMFRPASLQQKAAVAIARLDRVGRSGSTGALSNVTGRDVLTAVTEVSSPKQASEYFRSLGIPGAKYVDEAREIGQGTANYVIWDQGVLDRTALLEKNGRKIDALAGDVLQQDARGAVKFLSDGKAIVHFFESRDVSTALHEIAGHVARRNLPPKLQEMAEKAFGVKPGASWSRDQEEAFASGIEAYFKEGKAPTTKLQLVFEKFAAWLKTIYNKLMGTKLASGISPEMKELFDRMHVPTLPDNVASRLASGHMTQRTVNRHQGLAELLRDRENFREFGGFGNNPFVDHHEGTVKLNRSIQTANLLQRFVANSLSNELASRRSSQNFSRVRLAGQEAPGIRVEELMKNMPGLKMDTWLERTFERLKQNGTYAGELTPGIKSEILQHAVDPVVVKEFQDAFRLMNEVPVISDPLKWWDSLSTVMKSGLLATPSRINRDTFSSIVMAWTKGLLGVRDAKHIKNGLAIMRGKPIGWAPDTDEIRALVKQAGGDPDSVAERLRVFKTLWASRSGHGGMHDVLSGDEFARETSGQADRLLDIVPGARGEGIGAQIKRDLAGQSLGQKLNVVTNVAGTWYRDESGRWVQRSTNNALASISNRVSNVFDKGIKLGTMMAVLEKRGKAARFDDAYKEVSKALLNYQSKEFSQFERQVLKRIFPFYGFMSRSVAMVAGELATNPGGRLAQTIRAQRHMQDSEGYTPYELQDTAAVPLGKDAENNLRFLTGFGLMHEDAMQYLAPTQGYRGLLQKLLGSANPMIKQPIEYALNTSTFFEGPMGGRRLDDLDPTMGRLKQLIGERIGLLDPLKPGQSPKPIGGSVTESMVASSPAAAWLRIARTGLDPRKGTVEKLANILTGVRTKTMSPEAQIREIRDRVNAVEIEMGARPLTLTVGNKKLEERARAEGDQVKADRLKAARKVLEHIRKASEK